MRERERESQLSRSVGSAMTGKTGMVQLRSVLFSLLVFFVYGKERKQQ